MNFVANGNQSSAITHNLKQKEAQLSELQNQQPAIDVVPTEEKRDVDVGAVKQALYQRIKDLRGLFNGDMNQGRQALAMIMPERLAAQPVLDSQGKKALLLEGLTSIGQLVSESDAENHIRMASPRGFEPRLPP